MCYSPAHHHTCTPPPLHPQYTCVCVWDFADLMVPSLSGHNNGDVTMEDTDEEGEEDDEVPDLNSLSGSIRQFQQMHRGSYTNNHDDPSGIATGAVPCGVGKLFTVAASTLGCSSTSSECVSYFCVLSPGGRGTETILNKCSSILVGSILLYLCSLFFRSKFNSISC